jgi:hypothetical protein
MQEKEREKQQDELFNKIKHVTLPKQEWRRKEAPSGSTTDPAASGQTTMLDGQTARAHEAHGKTEDQVDPTAAPDSWHTEASGLTAPGDGHTVSLGGPTASSTSSCRA